MRKSRSWSQSSDGATAREEQERRRRCEMFGPDSARIDASAIQRVPMSDHRIVRTRTLMRNRPDTMRGAGIVVSTLKALVREGHANGVVYVVALESQPRSDVSGRVGFGGEKEERKGGGNRVPLTCAVNSNVMCDAPRLLFVSSRQRWGTR